MIEIVLAKKIASLLLMMLLGFVFVRSRLAEDKDSRILSKLKLYILSPLMILNSFQVEKNSGIMRCFLLLFCLGFAVHIVFIAVVCAIRKPLRLDVVEQTSIEYPNAGSLIIPIVIAMFGSDYVIYTLPFSCAQIILQWTHLISVMNGQRKINIRSILLNVNLISVVIGFALFLLDVRFPPVLKDVTETCTNMVGPVAMLITGMLLGGQNLKQIFSDKRVYLVCALRLFIFPLIALALYKGLRIDSWIAGYESAVLISFLTCCSCAAANIVSMAQLSGRDSKRASAINIFSTVACLVSMPLMVYLYSVV